MKQRVDEFLNLFPDFHGFNRTKQIVILVYFYSIENKHESVNRAELEQLFRFADVPVPKNLPQLLTYLSGRGAKLINESGEFSLRREVRQVLEEELGLSRASVPTPPSEGASPFDLQRGQFSDQKVAALFDEVRKCYAQQCWNACGLLVRIIIERTLDSIDHAVKVKNGLRDKINASRTIPSLSKSVREGLDNLLGVKLMGDVAAHHSKILLDKNDIDIVLPVFRMLLRDVTSV